MEEKEKCPFCNIELIKMTCPKCKREWGYYQGHIVSKTRKVKFKKKPEIGDNYNDIIEPVK